MTTHTKPRNSDQWVTPPNPPEQPETGYHAHVRAALAEAQAELDSGQAIPAQDVWKKLGVE